MFVAAGKMQLLLAISYFCTVVCPFYPRPWSSPSANGKNIPWNLKSLPKGLIAHGRSIGSTHISVLKGAFICDGFLKKPNEAQSHEQAELTHDFLVQNQVVQLFTNILSE